MSEGFHFLKSDQGDVVEFKYSYDPDSSNDEYKNIEPSQFLSLDEIVEHQLLDLSDESADILARMKEDELITLHHWYGRWIRNSYGLWHPNNPHIIKDDLGDGHPDGISMRAIEEIYKRLTTKHSAYDRAMSII